MLINPSDGSSVFRPRLQDDGATVTRFNDGATVSPYSVNDGATVKPGYVNDGATVQRGQNSKNSKDRAVYAAGRQALRKLEPKQIMFNPPLHRSLTADRKLTDDINGDYRLPYNAPGDVQQTWTSEARSSDTTWRLGHIIGAEEASAAYQDNSDFRYGFRFLYNPTALSIKASVNSAISPSAIADGSGAMFITAGGMGTVSMELLLNRIPEVLGGLPENPTQQDLDLKNQGTMVDLDFLFRTVNGSWEVEDGWTAPTVGEPTTKEVQASSSAKKNRKKKDNRSEGGSPEDMEVSQELIVKETGDIGVLIPNPAWLNLGPALRFYGWVQSVSHTHTMFSPDMVPIMTRVQITFQRIFKGTKEDIEIRNQAASQYEVLRGDVFEPYVPKDSAPGNESDGGGKYPAFPEAEKNIIWGPGPGPREGYKNIIAGYRAVRYEFPKINEIGCFRESDPYGDHPSALALDIMMPSGCVEGPNDKDWDLGKDIIEFFMENRKRFGVYYMIWQQRIWNALTESPKPLSEWSGMSNRGSCTDNHQDHVHLAFSAYPNDQKWKGRSDYAGGIQKGTYWDEESVSATSSGNWRLPVKQKNMYNPKGTDFGAPRDYNNDGAYDEKHTGEDYPFERGTPLVAMTDCKVVYIDHSMGRITMRTKVPYGNLNICYLHCWPVKVNEGDVLKPGDLVAEVNGRGSGNNNGYGPHLHLDFWWGNAVKPYGQDLLNPNEVLRALFGPQPGDTSGSGSRENYSKKHLDFIRNRILGSSSRSNQSSWQSYSTNLDR